jgi:hypothetical protein
MKSDYSYSNTIVYNNFLYPFDSKGQDSKTINARVVIELVAQAVLDARKQYQDVTEYSPSLAKLYNI